MKVGHSETDHNSFVIDHNSFVIDHNSFVIDHNSTTIDHPLKLGFSPFCKHIHYQKK